MTYNRNRSVGFAIIAILILLLVPSKVTNAKKPKYVGNVVQFKEYTFQEGTSPTQKQGDVEIRLEILSPARVYIHPELFAFDLDRMPAPYPQTPIIKANYKPTVDGRCWEYTFASPDGKTSLVAFKVKLTNGTNHILKMQDARVYLTGIEDSDPFQALSSVDGEDGLKAYLNSLEMRSEERRKAAPKKMFSIQLTDPTWPIGFLGAIVSQNAKGYKLINDVSKEILPEFSHEGILVFPVAVAFDKVTIAFYNIVTKTDPAGNIIEKGKFEFPLVAQDVTMWYHKDQKRWIEGQPPTGEEK